MYQISSTEWWATARETRRAPSSGARQLPGIEILAHDPSVPTGADADNAVQPAASRGGITPS
jgi:hypothetical protein